MNKPANNFLRRMALAVALSFAWMVLAPVAASAAVPEKKGTRRVLTASERQIVRGMQGLEGGGDPGGGAGGGAGGSGGGSAGAGGTGSGPGTGGFGSTNSLNGNKLTTVPLVGWSGRGGLPVSLALYHNSKNQYSGTLGPQWTHSYDLDLTVNDNNGTAVAFFGDDASYGFSQTVFSNFYESAPGIHSTLTVNRTIPLGQPGSGSSAITDASLTTKAGMTYTFDVIASSGGVTTLKCTSIKDRNNNTINFQYGPNQLYGGQQVVTSVTDSSGRALSFSYSSLTGKLSSVTDPSGRVFSISYSTAGDVSGVTLPGNRTVGFTYSAAHNILTQTDPRGKVASFAYDASDKHVSTTDALGNVTTISYGASTRTLTNPRGAQWTHTYDGYGRLTGITGPLGFSVAYGYSAQNERISVTTPRGTTTQTVDSGGNVTSVTDPLGRTTTVAYNALNKPISITSPLGKVTSLSYDASGNLIGWSTPSSGTGNVTVDAYGQVTGVTQGGLSVSATYDGNGNVTSVTEPGNRVSTATFDVLGRTLSATMPIGMTSYSYDSAGRVTSITSPGNRTISYAFDANSNVTSVTNPGGAVNSYIYDNIGRVIKHTDPLGRIVEVAYDAAGNKTGFKDGKGNITTYNYNLRDEITAISYPDGTSESYAYASDGLVIGKTDGRGVSTNYLYNSCSKMMSVSFSDGTPTATFAYNDEGAKTSMADGTGTTSYSYNSSGRLVGRTAPQGGVTYGYDGLGRVISRALSGAGVTGYSYNGNGEVTSVTSPTGTASYAYDSAGRITQVSYPNGATETRTYDSVTGELTSIWHKDGSGATISKSVYAYDVNGRKTSEQIDGGVATVSYGYDMAGQLTSEVRTGTNAYTIAYSYDAAGNRLTKTLNGVTEAYAYDSANKLLSAGSKSYIYDAAGNTIGVTGGGSTTTLAWNAQGYLKSATTGGVTTNYSYNALGQRVGKSGGVSASYALGDDAIDTEVLADGNATYLHGLEGVLSEVRGGVSKFYHSDALGSTKALTNGAGAVTDSVGRDAFGQMVTSSGTTPTPFGFAGGVRYQQDSETGLMRLGHRMYDSSTGRFISRDPIQDGYNWYAYCLNNPVNYTDSIGLKIVVVGRGGISDDEAQKKWRKSRDYLIGSPAADLLIGIIEGDPNKTVIVVVKPGVEDVYSGGKVTWDPGSAWGIVDDSGNSTGGVQSPALGLIHELYHAYADIFLDSNDPRYDTRPYRPRNPKYHYENPAEYYAIIFETIVAGGIGEPKRTNHYGFPMHVDSVIGR